jgi:hypothetical protein
MKGLNNCWGFFIGRFYTLYQGIPELRIRQRRKLRPGTVRILSEQHCPEFLHGPRIYCGVPLHEANKSSMRKNDPMARGIFTMFNKFIPYLNSWTFCMKPFLTLIFIFVHFSLFGQKTVYIGSTPHVIRGEQIDQFDGVDHMVWMETYLCESKDSIICAVLFKDKEDSKIYVQLLLIGAAKKDINPYNGEVVKNTTELMAIELPIWGEKELVDVSVHSVTSEQPFVLKKNFMSILVGSKEKGDQILAKLRPHYYRPANEHYLKNFPSKLRNEKLKGQVQIPGSGFFIIPPAESRITPGWMDSDKFRVSFDQDPRSYTHNLHLLQSMGERYNQVDSCHFKVGDYQGSVYIYQETNLDNFYLYYGDMSSTRRISGSYYSGDTLTRGIIFRSLYSIFYDPTIKIDPAELMVFTYKDSASIFKFSEYSGSTVTYKINPSSKYRERAGNLSISLYSMKEEMSMEIFQKSCIQELKEAGLAIYGNEVVFDGKINGYIAREMLINIFANEVKSQIYLMFMMDGNRLLYIFCEIDSSFYDILEEIQKLTHTIEFKK